MADDDRWDQSQLARALAAAERDGDQRPTWAYEWPAGQRLAAELVELVEVSDRRVVDLGCGRGRLGLTALNAGAARVLFADASPYPLAYLDARLQRMGAALRAATACHRWGAPLPHCPWDLILGGDILYRPECHDDVLDTVAASLALHGRCLLSDPRHTLESDLAAKATARGLAWQQERRDSYTLVHLSRRDTTP